MIKVLVVDDSIFMRKIISSFLGDYKDIEVVGMARNGKEAIELNYKLKPDIITMDIEMPEMNGLEALKKIMETQATKVIMLSSLTQEGAKETIEALEYGALDFVQKPSGQISLDIRKVEEMLVDKIRKLSKQSIKLRPKKVRRENINLHKFLRSDKSKTEKAELGEKIIAIGISTGGPKALQEIIPELPENIKAPILIVQHMPPRFTKSLADRLDLLSNIRVREAKDGDKLENGLALVAPGDYHMTVEKKGSGKFIKLNKDDLYSGHRPSANVLFRSVAKVYKDKIIGVIMTGMGGDGAEYLKVINDQGGKTIAQSEETCVVYGMPKVAVEMKAVDYIVDIEKIPNKILELLRKN